MILSLFGWLKSVVSRNKIREGDPVELTLGPNDQRAAQYDGEQGRVEEIIQTHRGQTLYAVSITGSDDTVYIEDHKVKSL